jgi:hypothetical protein
MVNLISEVRIMRRAFSTCRVPDSSKYVEKVSKSYCTLWVDEKGIKLSFIAISSMLTAWIENNVQVPITLQSIHRRAYVPWFYGKVIDKVIRTVGSSDSSLQDREGWSD